MENIDRRELTRKVVDLLSLKSKGTINSNTTEMQFHCPFHKDKTPSMGINFKLGVYNCFSCKNSGSIESLYKKLTSRNIYTDLGLNTINTEFSRFANAFIEKKSQIKEKVTSVFLMANFNELKKYNENEECLNYVIKRGIDLNLADKYDFMYAENTKINTTVFKDRLVIPIIENGIIVSLEGRLLHPVEGSKVPKVLYPKNCTTDTLFDIDNLDRHSTLYICEGLMDLFVLKSCSFFSNSTSIFGAKLTNRQKELLKEFDKVVYIPDLDRAGCDTMQSLKELGYDNIYYMLLPHVIKGSIIKDIGDLPKSGLCVEDLLKRKWTNYIKPIDSFNDNIFMSLVS